MQVTLPDEVREYIIAHDTMSLATTFQGKPWAAPVFYQVDSELRLYFISDAATRHVKNALHNPGVAVTIFEQKQPWESIQGVQIEGHLAKVEDENRPHVQSLYCEKFPFIANLLDSPGSDTARQVRARFLAADFYVVNPEFVRFIDNKQGFGFKEEYYLSLV